MAKSKAASIPNDLLQTKESAKPNASIPQTAPGAPGTTPPPADDVHHVDIIEGVDVEGVDADAPTAEAQPAQAGQVQAEPEAAPEPQAQPQQQPQQAQPQQQAEPHAVTVITLPGLALQPGASLPAAKQSVPMKALTVKVPEPLYRQVKLYCTLTGSTVQDLGVEAFVLALRAHGLAV